MDYIGPVMAETRQYSPVKLFFGILSARGDLFDPVRERLADLYGPIDSQSPAIPFRFTRYYAAEMGEAIERVFVSFERLIDAAQLPEIKQRANQIEQEMRPLLTSVRRPVNLDPGYLENAKVVLASTKNFYHRVYLERGIFAEVTMHFRNGAFHFFPWTYPDYQSGEYQEYFLGLRNIYRSRLKTMCILNREEQP